MKYIQSERTIAHRTKNTINNQTGQKQNSFHFPFIVDQEKCRFLVGIMIELVGW